MKSHLDCYPCFLKQAVETGRLATDDEAVHWRILRETLAGIDAFPRDQAPIGMGKEIQRIVRRLAENTDPYREIKKAYNRKALALLPLMESEIATSDNGILAALRMIALANIIDFGLFEPGEIDLPGFLHAKRGADFQGAVSPEAFIAALRRADSILYVADNCGEIIFDCHFINRFLADKDVYLSVRGEPVLNDATREDLEDISLHGNVTVLDTGDDSPGIVLETCGDAFSEVYGQADLVLLKGQGNFEGIGTPGRGNVYSLFVAKCPVIARHIGCERNDLVLTIPG